MDRLKTEGSKTAMDLLGFTIDGRNCSDFGSLEDGMSCSVNTLDQLARRQDKLNCDAFSAF